MFGQPDPDWFFGLPVEKQTRLLGWWKAKTEQAPKPKGVPSGE